jgi:uncharacterized damage-inducible protein DinB
MNKIELLLQGWDSCYEKEEWNPPLTDVLNELTAEQAVWRPDGEHVNTIWETINHLVFYKERFLKRLTGEESEYPSGVSNDDTFAASSTSEEEWLKTLSRLKNVHQGIREQLAALPEEQFDHKIPTTPVGVWIHNLILHDSYHTGQIVFLRKLQGSWPSRRSFD